MRELSSLPSEVSLEILSYLIVQARVSVSEREFFKYYFGRFSNGRVGFLFGNLEWKGCSLDVNCAWQLFRVEQMIHNHKRIDLIDPVKSKALSPGDDSSEELVLTKLDQLIERIDPSIVKSIYLNNEKVPKYIMDWALEKFTELDALRLLVSDSIDTNNSIFVFMPRISTFKNLKRLEIENCTYDYGLTDYFIKISRETPHMEIFKNSSLTSIFTAPEIFRNWKNLKILSSNIYLMRGAIYDEPEKAQVDESFDAIRKLEKLEKLTLKGELIELFGVPFCKSVKKMSLGLFYACYTSIVMKTISENTQLTELKFENGDWNGNAFLFLDQTKLTNLTKFSTYGITNQFAEHISKFTSIQQVDIQYASIDKEGLEHLLKLPNLKRIRHSESVNEKFLNYKVPSMIGNTSLENF